MSSDSRLINGDDNIVVIVKPEISNDDDARLQNGDDSNKPLQPPDSINGGDEQQQEGKNSKSCFNKALDLREAKKQILFSFPMIITNVAYYSIPLISVMFAGHLGSLELAGATLANSWATVTGYAFMIGLSGALETLCGQGFGAKLYKKLGIFLQSACIISIFFSAIISVFWFYTEPILILLRQDASISKEAALYMKFLIPGLFAYGFIQNILRFLQTQSVVLPLVVFSVLPMTMHIGIAYTLVHWTRLGYKGAPLAASVSLWISAIMLGIYVLAAKKFKHTWKGFSLESLRCVVKNLKLALPSAAMVCLEYWAFEILVFLAGLMPDSEVRTSLVAICVNTEAITYMISYGLSAAASTRVSNKLGAGKPVQAKHAMGVAVKLSLILALIVVSALGIGHKLWVGFFSDNAHIIKQFAMMTPFLVISIILDAVQGVLSGVARGCGWQHLAVFVNLGTFYMLGMPISIVLGFILKLYAKGLWIGLICGLSCQAGTLLLITLRRNWTKIDLEENRAING